MPPRIDAAKKILVRMPNWIGDVVLALPALERIRKYFPGAEIIAAAREVTAGLLRRVPAVNGVISVDEHRLSGGGLDFLLLASLLRREQFDLAVLLQNSLRPALLVRLAGIPKRAGYRRYSRGWLLNYGVRPPEENGEVLHESRYYLELIRQLGWAENTPPVNQYKVLPDPVTHQRVRKLLNSQGITGRPLRVAIAPGAANGTARCWPAERFVELADRLASEKMAAIVLCGAPSERVLGSRIAGQMTARAHVYFDDLSLMEMQALFSCMDVVVSNDSGAAHLAATTGVPQVVIFGPTDSRRTAPLNPRARIVRQPAGCSPCHMRQCPIDHRCMERLEVEQVWKAIDEIQTGVRA